MGLETRRTGGRSSSRNHVTDGRRRRSRLALGLVLFGMSSIVSGETRDNPSFSGDFDEIFDAAQEAADLEAAGTTVNENTFLGCVDSESDDFRLLTYSYAMVTSPSFDEDVVRSELESKMNEAIAFFLVNCNNRNRRRNLRRMDTSVSKLPAVYEDGGASGVLLGINSIPFDTPSIKDTCESTLSGQICTVVIGGSLLFPSSEAEWDVVMYYTLSVIRDFLSCASNAIPGLEDAILLSPEFSQPTGFTTDATTESGNKVSAGKPFSKRSIVIFSLSAVAFFGAAGVALFLRHSRFLSRSKPAHDEVGLVPTADDNESSSSHEESPISPFSKMLPAAYQLGDSSMSVILEHEEEEGATPQSDSIIVSDGWTTEDGSVSSVSVDGCSHISTPVLGARRRKDETYEGENAELSSEAESMAESSETLEPWLAAVYQGTASENV